MPDFDQQAARARCDAATPGPWTVPNTRLPSGADSNVIRDERSVDIGGAWEPADRDFIAAARSDLPAALDRIAELEAGLREARRFLPTITGHPYDDEAEAIRTIDRLLGEAQ